MLYNTEEPFLLERAAPEAGSQAVHLSGLQPQSAESQGCVAENVKS